MEKINLHNYEAYFLDYLEGTISVEDRHDLFAFLEQHPELKSQLEIDLDEVSLSPVNANFENKATLHKSEDGEISLNSVETWMLESVEGNLTESKQLELTEFVKKHQLEKTMSVYQATVLKPDLNEIFANKQTLKVSTGIVIPMYMRIAAAAADVALIIGVSVMNTTDNEMNVFAARTSAASSNLFAWRQSHLPQQPVVNTEETDGVNSTTDRRRKDDLVGGGNNQFLVEGGVKNFEDTTSVNPLNEVVKDNFVDNNEPGEKENKVIQQGDNLVITSVETIHFDKIVTEEPYKLITNAASDVTNRNVAFTRDRNVETNEYVAYGFKIGNFEFERKKQ